MSKNTKNKAFLIYKDSLSILDKLNNEEAGKLFKYLADYQLGRDTSSVDRLTEIMGEPFIAQFKRDVEKYNEVCAKRSEAGKRGNEIRWQNSQNSQEVANATEPSQNVANVADTNTNINTNSIIVSNNENNTLPLEPTTENKRSKKFVKPTVKQIAEYLKEINSNVDPQYFFDYYESKGWVVGKSPMKDWKATARNWNRSQPQSSKNVENKALQTVENYF